MVLETIFETKDGCVALVDFMPTGQSSSSVIRIVEGRSGRVAMQLEMKLRFDYGRSVPWVTRLEDNCGLSAVAGPNKVVLRTPIDLRAENFATKAEVQCICRTVCGFRDDVRPLASARAGGPGLALDA